MPPPPANIPTEPNVVPTGIEKAAMARFPHQDLFDAPFLVKTAATKIT